MMKILRVALILALVVASIVHAAEDARISVVERLYRDYDWETQSGISKRTPFLNEKSSVLAKYLTKSLSRLLLEDRKCSERTREMCRLDFSPLWNSQDPEGAKFHVVKVGPNNTVQVAITYPGQRSLAMEFEVVQTDVGWRVNDIRSASPVWSLRKVLSNKL